MNKHLLNSIKFIEKHGVDLTYKIKSGTSVYDPDTLTVTTPSTTVQLRMYIRHLIANHYNYPNLVGKDSIMFYVAPDPNYPFYSWFFDELNKANPSDEIYYNSLVYNVVSVQKHTAEGVVGLYRIVASRG
jgi:hypothetical protein